MTRGFNNLTGYQQMLVETAPDYAEPWEVGPKVNRVVKNTNLTPTQQIYRNISQTGKVLTKGGKALATGVGTAGKIAGKASLGIGAGITGYDAYRSFQIADEMEKINQVQPGRFPKEAIDFYRNKGKAITSGAGLGAGAGGILGSGFFSVPGALIGTSIGGSLAGAGYNLAQRKNPYANMRFTDEDLAILNGLASGGGMGNVQQLKPQGGNTGAKPTQSTKQIAGQVTGQAAPTTEDQLREILSVAPKSNSGSGEQTDTEKLQAINDYITKLQDVNRPYMDALSGYYNNYDNMLDKARRAQRYWQGIASVTGNPNWARISNAYNPLKTEAEKISMVKQMQDAQLGNVNAVNEMMGNLALAEELGLPPEAAFGNKNLLTALSMQNRDNTKLEIALANNLVKKYGIDKNYARALAQQALKNQGSQAVANTYMGVGRAPATGLTQQGTAQPTQSYDALGADFKRVTGK